MDRHALDRDRQPRPDVDLSAAIVASSGDPILVVSLDGVIQRWNHAAEEMFGYTAEEAFKRSISILAPAGQRDEVLETLDRIDRGEKAVHLETVRMRKDGVPLDVSLGVSPILDPPGSIAGASIIAHYATVPKRREAHLHDLLNSTPDAIVIVDDHGIVTLINIQAEVLFGWGRDELVGRDVEALVPERFRGEHRARRDAYLADPCVRAMGAGLELYGLRKDGREFPVEISISPVLAEDVALACAAVRDITTRKGREDRLKEAEDRFRGAFDSAAIGMALVALDGRWLDVNHSLCELVGYSEEELLAGGTFQAITHPDDLDGDLEAVRQMLAGEIRTYQMDKRYIHKLGHTIWIRLSVSLVRDADGSPLYFVSQIQDISQQKHAKELTEQLRHSQKLDAIGLLAGGVAHDFNNMLTAIKGYSQLLLDGLDERHPLRSHAEQIARAAEQASVLPRQLLTFSRKQPSQPKLVDINEVLSETSDMLERLVGEEIGVAVTLQAESAGVLIEPGHVEQVLVNLAINARDAMSAGGTLTLTTSNAELAEHVAAGFKVAPGPYVVVSVGDDGEGMDEEVKARIFEPFFTMKGGGSGLGLSTVHGIVNQAGGFVRVESGPGNGSVFEVWLPRADVPAQDLGPSEEAHGGEIRTNTVLLAEDEQVVRDLAVTVLERAGYRVLSAANGDEALEMCRQTEGIDVLVADMVMPGMGGRELAERVASLRPKAGVVLMSGYSEEAPVISVNGATQPRFLQKPFTPSALVGSVQELVEQDEIASNGDGRAGIRSTITCLVADDHPAVLDSVSLYLEQNGVNVVARASRGDEALQEILARRPSIALLDVRMQRLSGIEVARQASLVAPETQAVLYTGYGDRAMLEQALDAGARGFIRKEAPLAELMRALTAVAGGGTYVDPELAGTLASGQVDALSPLTNREQQVLALVADGMTNEKVATALGISAETVQSHVRNAMGKLDSDTRTQAVATAFRRSLLV